jgi:hypothetical protein
MFFKPTSPCILYVLTVTPPWHARTRTPSPPPPTSSICWRVSNTKVSPFAIISFILGSQILLSKLFSRILHVHPSLKVEEQVYQHGNLTFKSNLPKRASHSPYMKLTPVYHHFHFPWGNKIPRCLTLSIDIMLKHLFHFIWFGNIKGQFSIIVNSCNIGTMFYQVPENFILC